MRSAARLHGNRARWGLACKFGKGRPAHASAQDDPSLHIQANNAVQVLAQVDSKGHDGHWLAPSSQTHQHHNSVPAGGARSEEHTSVLQSLMRISYAVLCLQKKTYQSLQSHTLLTAMIIK